MRWNNNTVTGETKDLKNVSVVDGTLPFSEDGLVPSEDHNYKITAVRKAAVLKLLLVKKRLMCVKNQNLFLAEQKPMLTKETSNC